MKFINSSFIIDSLLELAVVTTIGASVVMAQGTGNMVKMCPFYGSPSGHARTDPIISQTCTSDHVHTVSFVVNDYFYKRCYIHPVHHLPH